MFIEYNYTSQCSSKRVSTVALFVGKLGHGDTNRIYKPKVVEALAGLYIRKVTCGSQHSLALTSNGQVRQLIINLLVQRSCAVIL